MALFSRYIEENFRYFLKILNREMGDFVIESFGSKFFLSENPGPCPLSMPTVHFFWYFRTDWVHIYTCFTDGSMDRGKYHSKIKSYIAILCGNWGNGQVVRPDVPDTIEHFRTVSTTVSFDRPKEYFSYYGYYGIIENYKMSKRN